MKHTVVLLLFLIITLYSFGQEKRHSIDAENSKCLENAVPTTIGSIKCEQNALQAWKAALSEVIEQIKTETTLVNVALFENAQKNWETFHKSDIAFYVSYYRKNYQGGSLAMAAATSYEKRQLRERVLYLLDFYEELTEQ
ncbi:lysozyme inhibitor LprI family protein [Kordia jejudonensis]|uniref:lysozyme inhibitor LprI family protein n=1 Tax=Kordia jejudonensis TaxID=1348245 RepID=UPI000629B87E|nr:lysozyme inhibitor LprI family protein [Kordia jejudonensis]